MNRYSKRQRRKQRNRRLWILSVIVLLGAIGFIFYQNYRTEKSYLQACKAFDKWEFVIRLPASETNWGENLPEKLVFRYETGKLSLNGRNTPKNYVGRMVFIKDRRSLPVHQTDTLLQIQMVFEMIPEENGSATVSGFGTVSWVASQEILPDSEGFLQVSSKNCQLVFTGKIRNETGDSIEISGKTPAIETRYRPPLERSFKPRGWFRGVSSGPKNQRQNLDFDRFYPVNLIEVPR